MIYLWTNNYVYHHSKTLHWFSVKSVSICFLLYFTDLWKLAKNPVCRILNFLYSALRFLRNWSKLLIDTIIRWLDWCSFDWLMSFSSKHDSQFLYFLFYLFHLFLNNINFLPCHQHINLTLYFLPIFPNFIILKRPTCELDNNDNNNNSHNRNIDRIGQ